MCRTLLPEKALITSRGGEGFDNWGCPYDPKDNRNFGARGGEGSSLIDRSWWRLEVQPSEQAKATEFLHVLSPILMPKGAARTPQQLKLTNFPAVTEQQLTPETVSFRIEQNDASWRVTLRRTGEPGGTIEHLKNGKSTGRWDLATEVKPNDAVASR